MQFVINTSKRDYYIYCDSEYYRDIWMEWIGNTARCYNMITKAKLALKDVKIIFECIE